MKKIKTLIFFTTILLLVSSRESFAVAGRLVLTLDNNITDKWYKTCTASTPEFSSVTKVAKNQYFSILVFFSDYSTDKDKKVNLGFDLELIGPDRKSYFKKENIKAADFTLQSEKKLILCEEFFRVCFEPEDKFGTYTVVVKIKDTVNKTSSELKADIELYEFKNQKYFTTTEQLDEWLHNYHKSPSPEKAIDAFIYCVNNRLFYETTLAPLYAYFTAIFQNNQFLIPYMMKEYATADRMVKNYVLYLFSHVTYDYTSFISTLPEEEQNVFSKWGDFLMPDPFGEISDATQLDMLWGIYLATGDYNPVRKIVETLGYKVYETTDDNRFIIYRAARWSLKSNCDRFQLVKDYCGYMLEKEELPEAVRSELTDILNAK